MSVVHQLSVGWLLDHLSFINKAGYQLCPSHQYPAPSASRVAPVSSAPSTEDLVAPSTIDITYSAGAAVQRAEATLKKEKKYVFREEFFHVFKPHIVSASQQKPQQGNSDAGPREGKDSGNGTEQHEGAKNSDGDSFASARKKNKRKCSVFNQGELDALEYHTKIRGLILEGTRCLIEEGLKSGFLHPISAKQSSIKNVVTGHVGCGMAELCEMAKHFPSLNENDHRSAQIIDEETSILEQDLLSCVTENDTDYAKIINLMGQKYLVPPKSSFLLSDISCMQPLMNYKNKYDVIVIDPPWQNKSVKRSNRYNHLSSWQIKQIPIPSLAAPNCLVVTWVTNRQKHLRFVRDELYPHWSVKTLAEWHWVKITRSGEFVFPLDSSHKKPYEVLVLGRVQGIIDFPLRKSDVEVLPIPDHKLIVSVPCTLHSHKPPLTEILTEYIKPDAECLELFARCLQPGWTSWGNEVLKFQHIDYFIALHNENEVGSFSLT
ncbi:N(6)-adenine-specific methyltransferase METTL4 isoform X1 [Caretta caretta]|uniref:N(6)-adenine-specific methyltransferase METTL4 isoform X1 n=1 Tax=Caretta caretta TaxID=8467 RepID=UPI0020950DA4|nr:N(6)-adenine-specific methyltransferase METTL4 isoform X1 [Caretta caretta]XP_048696358.1 N(6)-adenine-specific methyltransferase METTL4 isoform X1 [Caretta caretta]XP_048696359.1 N(6)-adenine-specific methyltransferase METTL4 isoform X1 [Caretta caretta]